MKTFRVCLILTASVLLAEGLIAQPACVLPPPGLVAWWRAEGSAIDTAGANHGTMIGGVSFADGLLGRGFSFSGGGDDYVALPENLFPVPNVGTGSSPFSFETWFKTSRDGVILGQQDIAPFDVANGYVPALYVGTNGYLYASLFNGSDEPIQSPATVNDGAFHHTAVTYDGANQVLFIDGVALGSLAFAQLGYATNYHYQLGTGYTAGWPGATGLWSPFTGIVDEPAFYNRALTPSEVASIFNAGNAGKCDPTLASGSGLRHRYSFNDAVGSRTVTDSIGTAHGVLLYGSTTAPFTNGTPDGSAFTGAGELALGGTNGYVDLPDGIISSLASVTFEAWVTWTRANPGGWQRIFDFGANDQGTNASGAGTNYLVITPSRGDIDKLSFEESLVNPLGTQVDTNSLTLNGSGALPLGSQSYLVITYDPAARSSQMFLNGVLLASASGRSYNPLNRFANYNNWLGRSQWPMDPYFHGRYDEFRIWEGTLTSQQIEYHYAVGPDQVFQAGPRPTLAIAQLGASLALIWPTNFTTGFHLESTPSLSAPAWTAVTNAVVVTNALYRVTLPATGARTFFRLKQ